MKPSIQPIAVVAAGCVLPGAENLGQFWTNLLEKRTSFSPPDPSRWDLATYVGEEGMLSSGLSGFISEATFEKIEKAGPNRSGLTRSHLLALGCFDQIQFPDELAHKKSAIILGCMAHDGLGSRTFLLKQKEALLALSGEDRSSLGRYFDAWEHRVSDPKLYYPSSLLKVLFRELKTTGEGFLVDAACASSMAAIDIACQFLDSGKVDFVITGGIDSSLEPENIYPFSQLGVLSPTGSFPFDKGSDGLIPSEGGVLLLLKRMSDVKPDVDTVLGVIEGVRGMSNGREASLFRPSLTRTTALYTWAKAALGDVDFVECHGTGTLVGDTSEAMAVASVFTESKPMPFASAKGNTGHCLAAAGAVSVLKALLAMKHRSLPPVDSRQGAIDVVAKSSLFMPNALHALNPDPAAVLSAVVHSAGFAGSNYTAIIRSTASVEITEPRSETTFVIVGRGSCPKNSGLVRCRERNVLVPPSLFPKVDPIVLAAIAAVGEALDRSLIPAASLDRGRVCVISAGQSGLDKTFEHTKRTRRREIANLVREFNPDHYDRLFDLVPGSAPIQEEVIEALNTAIVGRICMEFDFIGKSFHVDCDEGSFGAAIRAAQLELTSGVSDVVILAAMQQSFAEYPIHTTSSSIEAFIIATETAARSLHWPILSRVSTMEFMPCEI